MTATRNAALASLLLLLPASASTNAPTAPPSPATTTRESLLHVSTTFQEYDPFQPWQKQRPGRRSGLGVVVGENLVLTTEVLVRNQTLIEIRRPRAGERYAATIVRADPQLNLALLSLSDPDALSGLPAVTIADGVKLGQAITITKLDETAQVQTGAGLIDRMLLDSPPNIPFSMPLLRITTPMLVGMSGAPVFLGDELAGLVMGDDNNKREAVALPAFMLRYFLEGHADTAGKRYAGIASAGFMWQPLIDPAKRAHLGAEPDNGGVQLLSILPGSGAAGLLQSGDVLHTWAGHAIDNLGFYEDAQFGRLPFPFLIKARQRPGQRIQVGILRKGEPLALELDLQTLRDELSLIPENVEGTQEEYLVQGGFILRELSGRFIRAHRSNWQTSVDSRLIHQYLTRRGSPENEGDRIVILAGVLPDEINIGYQHLRYAVVEAVNGKPIRNMAEVFALLDTEGQLYQFKLKGIGVPPILDPEQLSEANLRMQQRYTIPSLQYRKRPADSADSDDR
jgi:S1-C subfamily serine protease